ncbi:hypothetical protein [Borrelia persica]|uniref:hypothetical protein n=1 Tax=Borrelia persica TaxID=44448 RepID=UPI00046737F4|nr:hypothetical protein [Borrelia persica]
MVRYNIFLLFILISIVSCRNSAGVSQDGKNLGGDVRNGSGIKNGLIVGGSNGIAESGAGNYVDKLSQDDINKLKTFVIISERYAKSFGFLVQAYLGIYNSLKSYLYCINVFGNCDKDKLTKDSKDIIVKMERDNIVYQFERLLNYVKGYNPMILRDSIKQLKSVFDNNVNYALKGDDVKMKQVVDVVQLVVNAYEKIVDTSVVMYADMFSAVASECSSKRFAKISQNFAQSIKLCMEKNYLGNALLVQIMLSTFESIFLRKGDIGNVKKEAQKLFRYRKGKELFDSIDELYVAYHIARFN